MAGGCSILIPCSIIFTSLSSDVFGDLLGGLVVDLLIKLLFFHIFMLFTQFFPTKIPSSISSSLSRKSNVIGLTVLFNAELFDLKMWESDPECLEFFELDFDDNLSFLEISLVSILGGFEDLFWWQKSFVSFKDGILKVFGLSEINPDFTR